MSKVIDATLRLIDKFTPELDTATRKMIASRKKIQQQGRLISKTGRNMEKTGSTLTRNLTLPIVGIGVMAVKTGMDFEAGMSKVQGISGATTKEITKLTDKAKEIGINTSFSATQASEAFSYMSMAGWKTKDMLSGIDGVMMLAGASGEELSSVSDIVTDSLTAFGLGAKDSTKFADLLASASANSNTNVAMLGESFKYAAPLAGALGYSAQDTTLALGLMANSGIKATQAGTTLRSMFTNLAKPTADSKKALSSLGISVTDSNGKMLPLGKTLVNMRKSFKGLSETEKASNAKMIAGKTGMSGFLAVMNASDKDFKKLNNNLDNSSGSAKKMYDIMQNNLTGSITQMKSALEGAGIIIGDILSPKIEKGAKFIKKLTKGFSELDPKTQKTIVKVAELLAVIGPGMLIGGKVLGLVGDSITKFGTLSIAVTKAGGIIPAVMTKIASPVGIAIIAITALVAVGVLLYKNWDKIKAKAIALKKAISKALKASGFDTKAFKQLFISIVRIVAIHIKTMIHNFKGIAKALKPVVSFLAKILKPIFKMVFANIVTYIAIAVKTIGGIVKGIITVLVGITDFIMGVFTGNWKQAWTGVKEIFSGIFGTLASVVKGALNPVIGLINIALKGINKINVKIPKWVPGIGGEKFGINIPTIPMLAKGTDNWGGGIAQINEAGGEIVDLPKGSRVYPHDESVKMSGKNITYNIPKLADKIVVREDADIDRIIKKLVEALDNTDIAVV